MKRLAYSALMVLVMAGVGAVSGVLYPYTELVFNQDMTQRQHNEHMDTLMTDNGSQVRWRACTGAGLSAGMMLLVLGLGACRRRREA